MTRVVVRWVRQYLDRDLLLFERLVVPVWGIVLVGLVLGLSGALLMSRRRTTYPVVSRSAETTPLFDAAATAETLAKVKELHRDGTISNDEYERLREQVLGTKPD